MTCSVLLQLDMGMHNILVGTSAQLVLILFTLPLMDPHRNKPLLSYINVILVPGNIKGNPT